jgi:hypothetical protein
MISVIRRLQPSLPTSSRLPPTLKILWDSRGITKADPALPLLGSRIMRHPNTVELEV